jgi:hypothetical protein
MMRESLKVKTLYFTGHNPLNLQTGQEHWSIRNYPEKVKMALMVDYLRMLAVSVLHKTN